MSRANVVCTQSTPCGCDRGDDG